MEPPFVAQPGQVDYTNIRWAPVINCVVQDVQTGHILLVKRAAGLRIYPGVWNGISGFLDDHTSLEEKVYEELKDEAGISADSIRSITDGPILRLEAPEIGKTWLTLTVRVEVVSRNVRLDWEADAYAWVTPQEAFGYDLMPGFEKVLSALGFSR